MSYHFSMDVLNIIILVYLMIDAPKYHKNALLWGILGFLFGPITLCVYLFQTNRHTWAYVWLVVAILFILAFLGFTFAILHMLSPVI